MKTVSTFRSYTWMDIVLCEANKQMKEFSIIPQNCIYDNVERTWKQRLDLHGGKTYLKKHIKQ